MDLVFFRLMFKSAKRLGITAAILSSAALMTPSASAAPLVPGTGHRIAEVGDDFEDPKWHFETYLPKSSANIDHQQRLPAGIASSNRVYESTYRGTPEIVKRITPPAGGVPGSTGALLMRSLQTGIPGFPSREMQQDDMMLNVSFILGYEIPVSWSPSAVVHVYVPPFHEWEQRTGSSFGFRADVRGSKPTHGFLRSGREEDNYWPGMFIQFLSKASTGQKEDRAAFIIRGGPVGQDVAGPTITEPGWWTLGMSFTPDGMVHYYASPGVDALTQKDHICSYYPYGFRAERFATIFFNVVNADTGRTWSTRWIIDDPMIYLGNSRAYQQIARARAAQLAAQQAAIKAQQEAQQAAIAAQQAAIKAQQDAQAAAIRAAQQAQQQAAQPTQPPR